MSLTDQIERLHRLREAGALTDAEFAAAKRRLIEGPAPDGGDAGVPHDLGLAANRYISFRMAISVVGVVLFLILLFAVFLPRMNAVDRPFDNFPFNDPTFVRP